MIVECLPHEFPQFIEAIRVLVNKNIACPTATQFAESFYNAKTTEYFAFHNEHGDFTNSFDEIFDTINLSYAEYEALKFKHKTLSGKEFYKEIFNKFNIKTVKNSNKVETNVSIPLEIAKEMYKSEKHPNNYTWNLEDGLITYDGETHEQFIHFYDKESNSWTKIPYNIYLKIKNGTTEEN